MNVSVVIPTYNSGPLVVEAVRSVLAQSRPAAEIIVIDDGSTDDTRERLADFASQIRYIHQPNQGVAAARNHGVRAASCEWVAFLDADDVWHPRKLEYQLVALEARPDLVLLGTATLDWPVCSWPADALNGPRQPIQVEWKRLLVKNYFTTSSVMVRRSILEQAGPFDTTLQGPEDYDLWLRIAELGPVANLPLPLTGYRAVSGSLSRQAARMERDMR